MRPNPHLSKSRYIAGLQCPKMLWWKVHEPDAPEAIVGPDVQSLLDRGNEVGAAARAHVPGGVLIDAPPYKVRERVAATVAAITSRAPVIYEASFLAGGVFVSVDILERKRNGYVLVEVKSTLDVKEEHLPDVALQLHILRQAGLRGRVEKAPSWRDAGRHCQSTMSVRCMGSGRAGCKSCSGPAIGP